MNLLCLSAGNLLLAKQFYSNALVLLAELEPFFEQTAIGRSNELVSHNNQTLLFHADDN